MNIGLTLTTTATKVASPELVNRILQVFTEADSMCPPGHTLQPGISMCMVWALLARWATDRDISDLNRALHILVTHANDELGQDPTLYGFLKYCFYQHVPENTADLETAIDAFKKVTRGPDISAGERFLAAQLWIKVAHDSNHVSLCDAYVAAISLLDSHAGSHRTLASRFFNLVESHMDPFDCVPEAAAYFIDQGRVREAVELLEQGRNIILTQFSGGREHVEALRTQDEGLALRFMEARCELDRATLDDNQAHELFRADGSLAAARFVESVELLLRR